jgi:hypothetical protein
MKKRNGKRKHKMMNGHMETIGTVIRKARLRKNIKVGVAAEACNVTRPHWHTWEKSRYILPKNIPRIAETLKVSERRLERVNGAR